MKIPKPRKLPSGNWRTQVQIDKKTISITEPTEQLCRDKAMLIKAQGRNGLLMLKKPTVVTLSQAIDNYILMRSNVLSKSTINGYREIQRNRFKAVMDMPIDKVASWPAVVNNEANGISAKTLKNAWSLVHSALIEAGVSENDLKVNLPKIPRADRPWLQPDEIKLFLEAIKGKSCELPALLALHSLRRSEIFDMKKSDISKGIIHVRGAMVYSEEGFVHQKVNKSLASSRDIPIMIPRIKELVKECEGEYLCTKHPSNIYRCINRVCKSLELPEVGFHGLRHSFASLCYHLKISEMDAARMGGWEDIQTMHNIYTHLADIDKRESVMKLTNFFE